MRHRLTLFCIVIILMAAVVALVAIRQQADSREEGRQRTPQWEHKITPELELAELVNEDADLSGSRLITWSRRPENRVKALNKVGEDGWELCGVSDNEIYWKRPKK